MEESIIQSAMHLTGKEHNVPDTVEKYVPPKKRGQKDPSKRQRNEKGQFIAGHTCSVKWTEEEAIKLAKALIAWMHEKESHFLLKDFLFEHDLYDDIIARLAKQYPQFAEYIARAKEIEAHRIQKFALANQLNSGMAQWVLAVHHKMHNVQKQEISADVAIAPPPQIVFED